MNWDLIDQLVKDKYISVQKHPNLDLWIYNYTQKCQFERMWTEETMACRGLIVDADKKIIAKPFKKFFNLDEFLSIEGNQLPTDDFEVFDKLDGSLGILYWGEKDTICLATRGSFVSDQAFEGSAILQDIYDQHPGLVLDKDCTYLFEIIYPSNRIVVNYGDVRDIYLLAVVRTESGEEMPYQTMVDLYKDYLRIVERFDGITDVAEIRNMVRDNSEGFVIRYPKNNFRLKLKYEEYVRLHRLVTGVNAKRIWEHLKDKQSLEELMERVPEEFEKWVKDTSEALIFAYEAVEKRAHEDMLKVVMELQLIYGDGTGKDQVERTHRKEFAERALKSEVAPLLFKLLDGKPLDELIWKMVKPAAEKPFKEDIDA